jgi:streptogramin lyase
MVLVIIHEHEYTCTTREFKIPNEKNHRKLTIDRNGNVYATGRSTNTIQRLHSNGTVDCVVLNEGDGVKEPLSIPIYTVD